MIICIHINMLMRNGYLPILVLLLFLLLLLLLLLLFL
jgi:hypothetical protein